MPMISTLPATITSTDDLISVSGSDILRLEDLTEALYLSASVASNDNPDAAMVELETKIRLLNDEITPLMTKTKKKLDKVEDEIANCTFLIDSGIGSKKDQAELRNTKRQLRQRRIKLWDELKVLPTLQDEKTELEHQLEALRRRFGVLDDL